MKTPRSTVVLAGLVLALGVSGCGSSGSPQNGTQNANGPVTNESGGQPGQGGAGGPGPGGSGKVAAVSGSTAQVQGQGGQVAVTWTSRTTFTQQVEATATDLEVGDCVAAMPEQAGSSDEDDTTVAAATVRIMAPVDGSCTSGMRVQDDGPRPENGNPPEGAPDDAPSGAQRRGAMGAFGTVTSVDGSAFEVESTRPGESDSSTLKVTTTDETTWSRTAKATAADVKVGRCVVSMGQADSTGAIKAASIAVSEPVDGQCAAMFGGPGMRRPSGDDDQGEEAQDS